MTGALLTSFRRYLEEQRDLLAAASDVPGLPACPDENEYASLVAEHHFSMALRERDARRLRDIETALTRIERGDYGFCEECGEEIAIPRLKALPTAALCVACQTLAETDSLVAV